MRSLVLALSAWTLAVGPVVALDRSPAPAEASMQSPAGAFSLEGVRNARDLGGLITTSGRTVRRGLLFRSGELSRLTPNDAQTLRNLDIVAIHDLRTSQERDAAPDLWFGPDRPRVTAIHYSLDIAPAFTPLFAPGATVEQAQVAFTDLYPTLLNIQRPQHRALFAEMLANDGAILMHCTAGKDRTGVASALILSALGVPRDAILSDYERSNATTLDASAAGLEGDPQAAMLGRLPPDIRDVFMRVDRRYLEAVFAAIERDHGSVDAYLQTQIGLTATDIERLRTRYTD